MNNLVLCGTNEVKGSRVEIVDGVTSGEEVPLYSSNPRFKPAKDKGIVREKPDGKENEEGND